jgi:DNA modification methylase
VNGDYERFLASKRVVAQAAGFDVSAESINPKLYDFQAAVTRWALRHGRAAIFADCGLGKSFMQLEWARAVGGTVLIVAPLAVSQQTARTEAPKLGLQVREVRSAGDLSMGINVTNYEMAHHFIGAGLDGIVLDESSILKSVDGKTRKMLLDNFTGIPYRLCCTATPCPNDIAELANHAQFLGVMRREEMLASFFVHDENGWRLRGHAAKPFYRWLASWAMSLKSPADIGFNASAFALPELRIHDVIVETEWRRPGELFPGDLKGITDRADVRRQSIDDRVRAATAIASKASGQVVVWCGLNDEAAAVTAAIEGAVEVAGSDSMEVKTERLMGFAAGKFRVLVSKPKIAGHGMNFQNASTTIFLGLSDSYEAYYQCIRRLWRYGQTNPVDAYVVVTDHETQIVDNVRRKELEAETLSAEIVSAAREYEMEELGKLHHSEVIEAGEFSGDGWNLYQGDCIEEFKRVADDSIDLSVFSPPFLALYTYSATERDLGNCQGHEQFFEHFKYVIDELLRVTKPGRNCCVHCAETTTTLATNGVIGLTDLPGMIVAAFQKAGWVYHGKVTIDKDPQAQAIRTHSKGLLFVQLKKDASWLRPALADYILVFRKPGDNAVPIHPDISNNEWIDWARPVWYGIRESDTLNKAEARSAEDDRHVCPLQLGTIERVVRLWSNPGELVLSPFAGIGSEGYVAIKHGRRFVGMELKPLYARTAAKNLAEAAHHQIQPSLFEEKGGEE